MPNLRRFYFDDGSSRKRWHVQSKGKLQIVEYGRIGGSLRESKKSFKSPREAAASTETLIASKKRGGYIEINPSLLEIARPKGKKAATEKKIQAFEKRLGCVLPEEYRNFLASRNGGTPNPPYIQVPGIPSIDNVGVSEILGLYGTAKTTDSLLWGLETLAPLLPAGNLPIACDSDVFTLSLKKKSFGCIYFWNHDTDEIDDDGNYLESASHLIAGSFDEFLTRIAVMFGVPEDDAGSADMAESSTKKTAKGKASIKRLFRLMNHDHTPAKIKEIEQEVKELGDLSGIKDGEWPFTNITNVRLLRCLLNAGLNPEITDTEQQTLLWQSAASAECVDLLLKYDVDIERRSSLDRRETALMRAICTQSVPSLMRLLEAGANPTVRLPWWIGRNVKRNEELSRVLTDAIKKWKRRKAKKK